MKFSVVSRRERAHWGILPQHKMFWSRRDMPHSIHILLSELVTGLQVQRKSEKCHSPVHQKRSLSGYEWVPGMSPTIHIAWWCLNFQHGSFQSREQHVNGKTEDVISGLHLEKHDLLYCQGPCTPRWAKEPKTEDLGTELMHWKHRKQAHLTAQFLLVVSCASSMCISGE